MQYANTLSLRKFSSGQVRSILLFFDVEPDFRFRLLGGLPALLLALYTTGLSAQQPLNSLAGFGHEQHRLYKVITAAPEQQCGSLCGKTMAMEGNLLVLGASYVIPSFELPPPIGARHTIVLENRWGNWVKVANLQGYVPSPLSTLSWTSTATSLAVEGDVIAVSDPAEFGGTVRVYTRPEGGWPGPEDTEVLSPNVKLRPVLSAGLGSSIAINNGTIVVGAPDSSLFGNVPTHGAVFIWEKPYGGWESLTDGRVRRPDHVVAPSDLNSAKLGTRVAVAQIDGKQEIVMASEPGNGFYYVLRRNGLTWRFDLLPLVEAGGNGAIVNELVYDGSTLLVGYENESFFDVAERADPDPTLPWNEARLARTGCPGDTCPEDDFGLGRSLALVPDGILAGDPFMYSQGRAKHGGLFHFIKPPGGWADQTLPWSAHYSPVFPGGDIPPPYPTVMWADSLAYDDGKLAANVPLRPESPFGAAEELTVTAVSYYDAGGLFRDGFEPPADPVIDVPLEPAKKLYFSKEEFCVETQSVHATGNDVGVCSEGDAAQIPDTPQSGLDLTVGNLRFTSIAPHSLFAGQEWTNMLPGPDIAVSDSEEFDVSTLPEGTDIYALGFTIFEEFEGGTGEPGLRADSLFTVSLFDGNTLVYQFDFNPMDDRGDVQDAFINDSPVFVGIWSDEPFDRVTLRETRYFDVRGTSDNDSGSISEEIQNEYFGPFFTGTIPRTL